MPPELALERVLSAHSRSPCQQGTALCCSCIQGCPCLSALQTVRGHPLCKHGTCIQRPAHGDIHVHPKCCHDVGLMKRGGPPHTTPCGFGQYHGCIAAPTGRQCTAGHNVEPGWSVAHISRLPRGNAGQDRPSVTHQPSTNPAPAPHVHPECHSLDTPTQASHSNPQLQHTQPLQPAVRTLLPGRKARVAILLHRHGDGSLSRGALLTPSASQLVPCSRHPL